MFALLVLRVEKKEIELRYEPLNMRQLVDEVTSSMRLQFEKKNAQVTVKSEGDTCVEGDRLHLVSVLFNLLDNALKYSSSEPEISILIRDAGTNLQLVVTDNGIGIPQKIIDKIFQPFFTTKPSGHGTGLGLSLSFDIVKAHDGEIKVETKEGEGTEFIVHLPV